jgi:signal transduction histidine kinase
MATRSGVLKPRPYARLLAMLSNQLIKNNTVALTELAKNSYDADASWVQVRIGNMGNFDREGISKGEEPFVEIEDDGDGMSFETIRDAWMNPASPNKLMRRQEDKVRTRKGRIMQGEKGIGRYAVFQIGKRVEIYTRKRAGKNKGGKEVNLITDISKYTDELLFERTSPVRKRALFFDQLFSEYHIRDEPISIKPGSLMIEGQAESRGNHGTLIRITELNYKWTLPNVKRIREILSRLQSPFRKKDFAVSIIFEDEEISVFEDFDLEDILEDASLKFFGSVDKNGMCEYSLNDEKGTLNLVEYLKKDWIPTNREHFLEGNKTRIPQCGPFQFRFYVYDLRKITGNERKRYLRAHRTYIYRDGIRVYPYGDSDNDWLMLDTYRGVTKVGYYLSNDQLIGYIDISTRGNPDLKDKTNREGLLEQGTAYDDLRFLTLSAVNFLHVEFQKLIMKPELKAKHRKARTSNLFLQTEKVGQRIDSFREYLAEKKDEEAAKLLSRLSKDYYKERGIYQRQIELVEDLAGVGIAVDAASHDVMVVMNRAVEKVSELQSMTRSMNLHSNGLKDKVDALHEQIMFMRSLLTGIQPLFRSSRRRDKALKISDVVKAVTRYYETPLTVIKAQVDINEIGPPLIVTSNEGILLQLFINLMDNSVYWLKVSETKEPKIRAQIDGEKRFAIFADNGPGVRKEDIDYIFEPFFSTKGLEGRGLGLYIARQLTDRYGYDLYYMEKSTEQILPGANFRIDFIEQEG